LFRFGRAYPAFWTPDGEPGNCARRVEWLSKSGDTLAVSDYKLRDKYLQHVCEHRSPRLAAHWEFLLRPIASNDLNHPYGIRLCQLEYYRMPLMAYLALEEPERLTRADFVRLAFAGQPGDAASLPLSESYLRDFEYRYCYDREWWQSAREERVRFLCC